MFAYCGNNPVQRFDPLGTSYVGTTVFASKAIKCLIAFVAATASFITLDSLIKKSPTISSKSIAVGSNTKTEDDNESKKLSYESHNNLKIYRYGGTNPGNLTPREKDINSGLSFSTIPRPGAAVTTIDELNRTGVVFAAKDGLTHVSVTPVGATMEDWISAGSDSIWTKAVKDSVIKWDGVG